MPKNSTRPKVILLKGNGPITVNNEMMELFTITLAHGLIGLPLKSLHADSVYIVKNMEEFWDIHKKIKEKPCCFVYSYDTLDEEDIKLIRSKTINFV